MNKRPMNKPKIKRPELCDNKMSFDECELTILRHSIEEGDNIHNTELMKNPDVLRIIKIIEDFLLDTKLVCYGGTAINNILPATARFYDPTTTLPDYDFFSPNALDDAKKLADIYAKNGFTNVVAKSGMHFGTYKVFVNYIPIADITYLYTPLYDAIRRDAVTVAGLKYAPPNYLRMSMFLELSRPDGDISRWEKVFTRLTLLNKYYPINNSSIDCATIDFQRKMNDTDAMNERVYLLVRDTFIDVGVIFFGGLATSLYSKYMPVKQRKILKQHPDFDVLHENPEQCVKIMTETLQENGIKNVKMVHHDAIGEIIPRCIELCIGRETVAFIYEPIACHNFNKVVFQEKTVNIATIDTILSFYLAFYYADRPYYNKERILCMANFLFDVEQKYRLEQGGILKRFSTSCYGREHTLNDIRDEKYGKMVELKTKKNTREYEEWFLNYIPATIPVDLRDVVVDNKDIFPQNKPVKEEKREPTRNSNSSKTSKKREKRKVTTFANRSYKNKSNAWYSKKI
jgi:hypothetical protein